MLRELDSYDWAEVFGEGSGGNCTAIEPDTCRSDASGETFSRENVETIKGQVEGENDGPHWRVWGRLKDGRWFVARGHCDYTGWDCQAGNDGSVATTENELIQFGMDIEERQIFGVEFSDEKEKRGVRP